MNPEPDSLVDLRSDTVTRPTPAMRQAMATAEVGDDVYGEDPTVAALEAKVAELLGKESALFVPSGTMANQIALMLHCRPGDAVFCGAGTHLGLYESGAAGALAGVQLYEAPTGVFDAEALRARLLPQVFYYARPRLLSMENTHNHSGGRVFPRAWAEENAALARDEGLRVHLDGARLWNASAASGEALPALAAVADTVSVCFSKGLGAPVGSALAMAASERERALHLRRRMGGALRQAGILAAAALHALAHHREDLPEDHRRARELAAGLVQAGYRCELESVETNIVVFEVEEEAAVFMARAREQGVALGAIGPRTIRAVTHRDLTDDGLVRALEVLAR